MIGNAYFFTWLTTIVVFEGFMWFIHDRRKETHLALKEKEEEYLQRQRDVLEQTKAIQRKHEEEEYVPAEESESARKDELSSEFFDAAEEQQESRARFAT